MQGTSPFLKQRLLADVANNVTIRNDSDTRVYPNPEDGFSATENWVEHIPNQIPVENPARDDFCAPTNRNDTVENQMHDFDEVFDQPVFFEKAFECELTRGGNSYKKDR